MTTGLKESLGELLNKRAEEEGYGSDFVSKIADETNGDTEEEVMEFISQSGHPAMEMDPMF